ncbi:MAG: hypothetical protein ABSC08_14970 [Bryobacteraceae bacterium]|jgi:hypothetical protein
MQARTFLVTALLFPALVMAADRPAATIVDTTGVQTEVTELKSCQSEFGGLFLDQDGFSVVVKKFKLRGNEAAATCERWLHFDEVAQFTMVGSKLTIELKTGETVTGSLPESYETGICEWRGKWTQGDFVLSSDKIKSVTFHGTSERQAVPSKGPDATITLRDGAIMKAQDVRRHCIVSSGYINVPASDEHFVTVWIEYKRGAGVVKTELPFSQVKLIAFDRPVVTTQSYGEGDSCKITLRDGSVLAGHCSGEGQSGEFHGLVWRVNGTHFAIWTGQSMGFAVQSIQFSE